MLDPLSRQLQTLPNVKKRIMFDFIETSLGTVFSSSSTTATTQGFENSIIFVKNTYTFDVSHRKLCTETGTKLATMDRLKSMAFKGHLSINTLC